MLGFNERIMEVLINKGGILILYIIFNDICMAKEILYNERG